MTPQALGLVLTAAVAHALWNFAAKRVVADKVAFVWCYVLGGAVVCLPVAVIWLVVSHEQPTWAWLGCAAVSAALHIAYQLSLQHGYAVGEMNLVYPLARGTGPLVTFLVAVSLLGDRPGGVAVGGVAAVITGVLLICWQRGESHRSPRAGAVWGVTTGLTIAGYTLWDNYVVNTVGAPPLPYFTLGMLVQLVPLTIAVRGRGAEVREVLGQYRRELLTVAALSPLAYVLVLRAMQLAPVALVAPARESSIVVGSLLGWLVLKEPRPARRLLGAAVVLAGIAALAVG